MLLLGRRVFSVEGATLEPPRDEVMEGLSLYYMHGFENMHWVCTNRVWCDEAVGPPVQPSPVVRREGITILAGVVGPTKIGVWGSEKRRGWENRTFESGSEYNCKSSAPTTIIKGAHASNGSLVQISTNATRLNERATTQHINIDGQPSGSRSLMETTAPRNGALVPAP